MHADALFYRTLKEQDVLREQQVMNEEERNFYLECEKHWVFWSLITVGGFYGGYTFCVRGGVFCNAQTANVVLLAMAIGQADWERALYLLIPISAYFGGAIVSEILGKKVKKASLRWKMHGSMILFFLAGGILSTVLCTFFDVGAIIGAVPILVYTFIRLCIADRTYERDLLDKTPRGH